MTRPSCSRTAAASSSSAAHSGHAPAIASASTATAGGTSSNGASCEWEWGSDAPAPAPSFIPASRYARPAAACQRRRRPHIVTTSSASRGEASAKAVRCAGPWMTTSWPGIAGYLLGTTRTVQPGPSGSRPSAASTAISGGVWPSCPSQKGQVADSLTRVVLPVAPGRPARPGATSTSAPFSGFRRRSRVMHPGRGTGTGRRLR